MKIVELNQLTKHYKGSRGILDISFDIREGEIFGFIGPNGSGKSTTIRTLLNFIYPSSGSAKIFGKDIVEHSKEIRRLVGYLPSEIYYYDDMKVIDLLQYSEKFYGTKKNNRIQTLAEKLDLQLNRKVEELSFGNRKKVGIIQALLHEPKLLILDEPTGGLDPLIQKVFFDLLKEEQSNGATIFFSSHILSEVQKMCDRVAIIKEGQLVQVESIETLTKNNFKKVIMKLREQPSDPLEFPGIIQQQTHDLDLVLLYRGDIQLLLHQINQLSIQDLKIEEPSLEEIFMHYYER